MEQGAIMSRSDAGLANAGWLGLLIQALTMVIVTGMLWYFSKDERVKSVYAGWLGASMVAFPAILLRFVGTNNDQVGFLIQFIICLTAFFLVSKIRNIKINLAAGGISLALFLSAFGVAPFVVFGAFGSLSDVLLGLLTGLSMGLLAAVLMESTTGNRFIDSFGIASTLALLASAVGYDGSQLILLGLLPSFAFAVSTVMPSRVSAGLLVGILAATGLIFFDPTELTILLGDILALEVQAIGAAFAFGIFVGVIALAIKSMVRPSSGFNWMRLLGPMGAGFAWILVISMLFVNDHRGFYGDRLFVIMKEQADLSHVSQFDDIDERRSEAYREMTRLTNVSQADIRIFLDKAGVHYTSYYLVNAMEVRGGILVRLYLSTRPEVERVIPSPRLRPAEPVEALALNNLFESPSPDGVQWNIKMIGADKVWDEFNARGEGILVGQSDSGADGNHPEIRDSYRGVNEGADYNWFDPWNGTSTPVDNGGHGTHTLGTILGKNGIGVAPDAEWIGCVNLDRNLGNAALYLDCMQFMLAPFPQGGDPLTDGDPTRAADVLNNSWGCPPLEGCDPNALIKAVENLRAAGIFIVASTGNDGPDCNTISDPPAIYDSAFSVGAVDRSGNIAYFSSRGPVLVDDSGRIKPDISAPGVNVYSALPGGGYGALDGTSMAGPHVTGAVALLWSAAPYLIGDIDRTEQILIDTAQPYVGEHIGCFSEGTPNNAYGYGILNVYDAVKEALDN